MMTWVGQDGPDIYSLPLLRVGLSINHLGESKQNIRRYIPQHHNAGRRFLLLTDPITCVLV